MNVCYMKKRYVVTLLVSLGYCVLTILQLNLSVTIVDITSTKLVIIRNKSYEILPEFRWSQEEKGLILSICSYGYIFSLFGSILANKIGGATVYGMGIAINGILSILTPYIIRLSIILFILLRLAEGIFQGFIITSLMEVFIHWTPPNERSRLIVFGINGCYIGAAIAHPLSGFIIKNYGWETVFFITGGISLVWYLIWVIFVRNTPAKDKLISEAERSFLIKEIGFSPKIKVIYPWKSILISTPVWALVNEFFTLPWSYSFLIHDLPLYISDVQHKDIQSIGLLSSIPSVSNFAGRLISAFITDYLRNRQASNIHKIYKIFVTIGQLSAAILLIVTALWMNFEGSLICFSLFRFFFSFAETCYEVLPADIALQYAGIVRGMMITAMAIGLVLSPTIMGFIVSDHSRSSWNKYILFLSVFNVWSLIIFLTFGSAKPQSWAKPTETESIEKENSMKIKN